MGGMNATSSSPPIGGVVLQRPHAPAPAPQLAPASPVAVGTGAQHGSRRFQAPCATQVTHSAAARSPSPVPVATTAGSAIIKPAATVASPSLPVSHPGGLLLGRNSFGLGLHKNHAVFAKSPQWPHNCMSLRG